MSTLPYLPSGEEELPAERSVIFAGENRKVWTLDESKVYPGMAFWESGSLNRGDLDEIFSLATLQLIYSASGDSMILVEISRDGGETWEDSSSIDIFETTGGRSRFARAAFHETGEDIRFRIIFPDGEEEVVNVFGFLVTMIRRGRGEYAL